MGMVGVGSGGGGCVGLELGRGRLSYCNCSVTTIMAVR